MKSTRLIKFFAILFIIFIYQPAFVLGDTIYFDVDGNVVDQEKYEQTALDQEKYLSMKLENGYNLKADSWKDPIRLRKKRIEQWKIMRSHYHPDSLPAKIENTSDKNK